MSALGEMAGGIAHEVNNPLSIILGKARQLRELIESGVTSPPKLVPFGVAIEETAQRVVKIVNGLRTISRNSERDPMVKTAIGSVVDGVMAISAAQFKYREVEPVLEMDAQPTYVNCRAAEISQVLLNLIGNALDAVAALPQRWVKLAVRASPAWVEVSVEDSGPGVPPAVREQIFRPFFTTKEVGKGTGLGLSISRSIVESHGGTCVLDAAAPNARFVIRLPVAR
jgi:C4-dicarboxylate-specific signal transduction histidine kinase